MNYFAKIERLSADVEEEVVLLINGVEVTCFASLCPFLLEEQKTYQVALTAQVFGEYVVNEGEELRPPSIVKIGNGFSYILTGKLLANRLEVGSMVFEDDVLLNEFGYLEGKSITWKVDRIDVDFLSND